MEDVDYMFCYRHFRALKEEMKRFAAFRLDARLSDFERRKLAYVEESVRVTAQRTQLLIPLFLFCPILLTSHATRGAKIMKMTLSVVLAVSMSRLHPIFENAGVLLALPSAIQMLAADVKSNSKSSLEMMQILAKLKEKDEEKQQNKS